MDTACAACRVREYDCIYGGRAAKEVRKRFRQLRSLYRALRSFILYGDASIRMYTTRKRECRKCDQLRETQTGLFCAACGCPEWPISDLRTKWRMVAAECPLKYW